MAPVRFLNPKTHYMSKIATMTGKIRGGVLYHGDRTAWNEIVRRKKDCEVEIILSTVSVKQTDEQRGYYHSTVKPHVFLMLREAGYDDIKTIDDAHWMMKMLFLPRRPFRDPRTGDVLEQPGSTSGLDKEEYSVFLDQVLRLAAELGYYIPPPTKERSARKALPKQVKQLSK